ncbi:MAG: class I SAM-dependent rRNA methyltransferase [Firmicutes bacterium]|nr:class I SAM-dependent rRNA methyltransferase [Bacillota bacterium]
MGGTALTNADGNEARASRHGPAESWVDVYVSPPAEERVRAGSLWVFEGEIVRVDAGGGWPEGESLSPGVEARVLGRRGRFLGRGYYNPAANLAVRLLSRQDAPIDEAFWRRRLEAALAWRHQTLPGATAVRLVHGEADLLPGLVVDRYGPVAVVQFLTAGTDARRRLLSALLWDLLQPLGVTGLYERSDVSVRKLEGLEARSGVLQGQVPPEVEIEENGLRFRVDVRGGQKTGYYLDQKLNRARLAAYVKPGERVLDVFCHTGAFALHAAHYGAAQVIGVDSSAAAVAEAGRNAALNGLADRCQFVEANAFDWLREWERKVAAREAAPFGLVILDPPAFAPGRRNVEAALRGYKEINLRALRLVAPGGHLVTASCSHHIQVPLFEEMLRQAAADSGVAAQIVEKRGASPDHPALLSMPETEYLKLFVLRRLG